MFIIKYITAFILAAILAFTGIFAINYFGNSIRIDLRPAASEKTASQPITVLNWNLGYAGLGKESDFVMDGGQNLQPPSREIVEKNLMGIIRILAAHDADIYQFQEISKPDMLTLGVNILAGVDNTLPTHDRIFSHDFATRFIPKKWALKHGLASYSAVKTQPPKIRRLPNETERLGGVVRRQYHMIERRFTDKDEKVWVFLNVHLAAFDEGGKIRRPQLRALLDYVEALYAQGQHIVVGGDWNLQLTPTEFPYTTDKELLFWLEVFPEEALKPGWALGVDPSVPTVRSNERPYSPGENYTTIIDGFLVSPNVHIDTIKTLDTGFEYTDHQPILASFVAKSTPDR